MKKLVFVLGVSVFAFAACSDASSKIKNSNDVAQTEVTKPSAPVPTAEVVDAEGAAQFTFVNEKHDFGEIQQGEKVSTVFEFTNTGDAPLIISNAKGSCGCTVPEWPKEPVAPGEKGSIKVEFDSKGKSGVQTKTVNLTANTVPNTKVLTISANIQVPAAE